MLSGILLIVLMITFLGIFWWAWNPKNSERFKEAAQLPLKEDQDAFSTDASTNKTNASKEKEESLND